MIYNNTGGCTSRPQASTDSKTKKEIEALQKLTNEINGHLNDLNVEFDTHVQQSDQNFSDIMYDVSENTQHLSDVDLEQLATSKRLDDLSTSFTTDLVDAKTVLADGFGITNPDDPSTILPVKFYKNVVTSDPEYFICNLTGKQILIMKGKNGSKDFVAIEYAGDSGWIAVSNYKPQDRDERFTLNAAGDLLYTYNSSIPTAPKALDIDIFVIGDAPSPVQVDAESSGVDIRQGITTSGNMSNFSMDTLAVSSIFATTGNINDLKVNSTLSSVSAEISAVTAGNVSTQTASVEGPITVGSVEVNKGIENYMKDSVYFGTAQSGTLTYVKLPKFWGEVYLHFTAANGNVERFSMSLKTTQDSKNIIIDYSKKTAEDLYRIERVGDDIYLLVYGGGTINYGWNTVGSFRQDFVITIYPNTPPYTPDDVTAYYECSEMSHTVVMGDGTGLSGMYVVGGLGASTLDFGGDLSYDNLTITNNLSVGNSITTKNITSGGTADFNQVNGSDAQFATLDITGQTIAKDLIVTGDTHGTTATFNDVNTTNFNGKAVTDIFESDGTTVKKAANDIDNNPINTTYSKATNLVNGNGAQSIRQAGQTQADGVCSFASGHTTVANGNYSHAEGTGGGGKAWTHQCNVKGDFISSWTSWNGQTELPNVSVGDTLYIGTDISPYSVTKIERRQEGGGPSGVTTWIDIFIDRSASQTGMQDIYSYTSTTASGEASHAEGIAAKASGSASHAEGMGTTATGAAAHSEGLHTIATGDYQTAIGKYNNPNPYVAFVIGGGSGSEFDKRKNIFTVDWDGNVKANNLYKSAFKLRSTDDVLTLKEGIYTIETEIPTNAPTLNPFALVEVTQTFVGDNRFHTIYVTYATKNEVYFGTNTGGGWTGWSPLSTLSWLSHGSAEGSLQQIGNTASGKYSFAEGLYTTASQLCSHAEGQSTTASGDFSHAEGYRTTANGICSHAEGDGTTASEPASHAQGRGTIADSDCMTAIGRWNKRNSGKIFAIGNGTGDADNERYNVLSVSYDGSIQSWGSNMTTMKQLGFSTRTSVKDFFKKVQERVGSSGSLYFQWSDAESQIIFDSQGRELSISGCSMFFNFDSRTVSETTWSTYAALLVFGGVTNSYTIRLQFAGDLANPASDILAISTTEPAAMSAYNTGVTV